MRLSSARTSLLLRAPPVRQWSTAVAGLQLDSPLLTVLVPSPMPHSRRILQRLSELCHPPSVYLGHAPLEPGSEVASREMDVLEGGGQTAMPGERGNGMQFPACTRQIGQAEMPQSVRAKAGYVRP